ncbi:MAG TPA: uroporphyrinogen decarboxylase family protein, partial [bacterium]|nr:uroporphyrinogen decarboxylase family protein [bacterium]
KRLQPDSQRIPPDLDQKIAVALASGLPVVFSTASLMGWIRNWMGVVNMSYLMYDAPTVYADMVMTLTDLTCWAIDQVFPKMGRPPDMAFGWEDICGKAGPLVSPDLFRKYVAPGYRRIREKIESYGVSLLGIDSDGDVRSLVGPWLEAGVNVQFPVEIGTWQADPYQLRRQFGRELRIIGGFNKLALEKGPAEIDAEIARRWPLMKEGGFVLMPDHLITPGTSLDNYRYFLNRVRSLRF